MPIHDTHTRESKLTEHAQALRFFTDRHAERRLFARYLHAEPPPEQLLFFHGDGGNGKSLLLKRLCMRWCKLLDPAEWRKLEDCGDSHFSDAFEAAKGDSVPCIYHDLGAAPRDEDRPQEDWSALMMLRRRLGEHGIQLPLFDFAVTLYLSKMGTLTPHRIKALFPAAEADFVGNLVDLITDPEVPFAGLAGKLIGLFDKNLKTRLALWRSQLRIDKERVRALQELDEHKLAEKLPVLFGENLNAAMQLKRAPRRIVLFFDTHESFWGTRRHLHSTEGTFQRDRWLRALLAELYNPNAGIVCVVAGRKPPLWPHATTEDIPQEYIDTQLVGHLNRKDAERYLDLTLGSVEPSLSEASSDGDVAPLDAKLKHALIQNAEVEPDQVHPFLLGLTADLVLQARRSGSAVATTDLEQPIAGGTESISRELVERLLRYCPREVEIAVMALAAARKFDFELFREIGQRMGLDCGRGRFETLTDFSFVWQEPGGSAYSLHELLRRSLAGLKSSETAEAHAALEAVFRERSSTEPLILAEAVYHANQQRWREGLTEWQSLIRAAMNNSNYELAEALAELRPVLRIESDIDEADVARLIGEMSQILSRYETAALALTDAVTAYDAVLERVPDDIGVHNNRGLALQSLGELRATLSDHTGAEEAYEEAMAAYDVALERAPDDVRVHNNRGNAFRSLAELRAALSDHTGAGAAYEEAIAAYDTALDRTPGYVNAHDNRGIALQSLGELRAALGDHTGAGEAYEEAIAAYDAALERAPGDVDAHINRGNVLRLLGELRAALSDHTGAGEAYKEAIAACDAALERAPGHVNAHINRGNALGLLGALRAALSNHSAAKAVYEEAITAYDAVLERAPDDVDAYTNRGNALASLGELRAALSDHTGAEEAYEKAIAAYDAALERAPDYVDAHNNRGNALASLGELRAALSDHTGAEEAYEEAIAACDAALERAPDDFRVHNNRGNALGSLGESRTKLSDHTGAGEAYEDAIAAYDAALERAPDDVRVHNNRGNALQSLGAVHAVLSEHAVAGAAYEEAIAAYDAALERAADYVRAHINRGNALRLLGELRAALSDHAGAGAAYEEAIAAFDAAIERAPSDVDARTNRGDALQSLGELRAALSDYARAERAYEAAIAAYNAALERAPNNVSAILGKGEVLRKAVELDLE